MKKTKKRIMSALLLVIMIFTSSTTIFASGWDGDDKYIPVCCREDLADSHESNEGFFGIAAFSMPNRNTGEGGGGSAPPPIQHPPSCQFLWCNHFCNWLGSCNCQGLWWWP